MFFDKFLITLLLQNIDYAQYAVLSIQQLPDETQMIL